MQIQTLNVVVPTRGCVNECPFCISRMGIHSYTNHIETASPNRRRYEEDYVDRLAFCRDNGCNTVLLTGCGEVLQNPSFLDRWDRWNSSLGSSRFRCIEIQTTGVFLSTTSLEFLRDTTRVSTIALSVVDPFHSDANSSILHLVNPVDLDKLCKRIKEFGFTLRLSLNLTKVIYSYSPEEIFARVKSLGVDQLTLRTLCTYGRPCKEDEWIKNFGMSEGDIRGLNNYVSYNGKLLESYSDGRGKFSIDGVSVVLDGNCMEPEDSSGYRYLILREDCRLYSSWSDPASLVF